MKSRTLAITAATAGLAGLGLAAAVTSPAQAATRYHRPHISACAFVHATVNPTDVVLYEGGRAITVDLTAPSGQRLGVSTGSVVAVDPNGNGHAINSITRITSHEMEARGTLPGSSIAGSWSIDAAATYTKTRTSDTSSSTSTKTCLATAPVQVRRATYLPRPTATRNGDTVNIRGQWTALNAAGTAYVGARNHSVTVQYKPYSYSTGWGVWTTVDGTASEAGGLITDSLPHSPGAGDYRIFYGGNSVDSGPTTSNVAYVAGS